MQLPLLTKDCSMEVFACKALLLPESKQQELITILDQVVTNYEYSSSLERDLLETMCANDLIKMMIDHPKQYTYVEELLTRKYGRQYIPAGSVRKYCNSLRQYINL
jgi:hypothetical protein